ncbi:MAG: hypothetical protein WCP43_04905, partial [Dehalococcoidia bacterium]
MKKIFALVAIMAFACVCAFAQSPDLDKKSDSGVSTLEKGAGSTAPKDVQKDFNVYTDKFDRSNHYIPSGYMGDYGDIRID